MSFRCEHCGAQNNEIQDAGIIRGESGEGEVLAVWHDSSN